MTYYTTMDSPVGPLLLTADGESVTGVYMTDHEHGPAIGRDWVEESTAAALAEAARQLAAYFNGAPTEFNLPLAPAGTAFQKRVWEELVKIPYGMTVSYGEIAERIGKDPRTASRAVGLANGRNPISIIVPCHRVPELNHRGTEIMELGVGGRHLAPDPRLPKSVPSPHDGRGNSARPWVQEVGYAHVVEGCVGALFNCRQRWTGDSPHVSAG